MRGSLWLVLVLAACAGSTAQKDTSSPDGDTDTDTDSDTDTDTDSDTDTDTDTDTHTGTSPTAPDAQDDALVVDEGGQVVGQPLTNDTDPNDTIDPATLTVVDQPRHGSLEIRADGLVRYTHDGGEDSADSFTYVVDDSSGETSNLATVDVTIDPVNDPPVAADDAAAGDEGALVVIDLAANDDDVDDGLDLASLLVITPPAFGTVTVNADGTVDYVHDGGETASDTFRYGIRDLAGAASNPATVTVTLSPVNDPPTAVDDRSATEVGGTATIRVSGNDRDPDDGLDLTSVVVTVQPAYGTVVVNGDGTVDYTHDGGTEEADSFEYTIADASGAMSAPAVVSMVIGDGVCIPGAEVFAYTGAAQVFVAPCTGVFLLEAWGAEGAGGNGGLGGYASGSVALAAGEVLEVYVGGRDGFNGGGAGWAATDRNGGGASDLRLGGAELDDRILVAGGGGGGGPNDIDVVAGGAGGGGACGATYCGGGGAEGYGAPGGAGDVFGGSGDSSCHSGGAGGGGEQSGGAGSCNTCYTNTCGATGALGQGGASDTWENGICYTTYGGTSGGGGGYWGGGGSSVGNCGGGGGGGGSSWTGGLDAPVLTGGVRLGDGEVVISY
jgi:hypothetical protein